MTINQGTQVLYNCLLVILANKQSVSLHRGSNAAPTVGLVVFGSKETKGASEGWDDEEINLQIK